MTDHGKLVAVLAVVHYITCQTPEDGRARAYLADYNLRAAALDNTYTLAAWDYNTNITDYNKYKMINLSLKSMEFNKKESLKAARFNLSKITDEHLTRQLNFILDVGISGYEDEETLRRISDLNAEMKGIYSSAKWCKTQKDCKPLEPDLTDLITNNRNYDELKAAWKGWRDVSGAKMRDLYSEFVSLMNKAIKAGGKYSDMGDYYRSMYEQPTFEDDIRGLYDQLSPLYDQLHAYVRRKLRDYYGSERFPTSGHIPAHLFGNMWAQNWRNIYTILEPYPGKSRPSLTETMKIQNYTITQMYWVAEEFFTSIGMGRMPESFWRLSMLEKPADGRDVVCHASAWDFSNGTDFRIKQCTTITEDQFNTVHHEMGHIEYYLAYMNQPYLFRRGANPGFHEGVADIASLSFQTPEHLKKIGLLDELPTDDEGDINFLFKMALSKVAFLPFGYMIDQWRWSVFRGDTTHKNYNKHWWDLRCNLQGVHPPVARSEEDFDPGAKFHIPANVPYIRYFVSFVAQFQWHKALCELIGKPEPLHRCDIYRDVRAGKQLLHMLEYGGKTHWGEAMRRITMGTSGTTTKLDAAALLGYFAPLQRWLEEDNRRAGETVGWDKMKCPPGTMRETSGSPGVGEMRCFLSVIVLIVAYVM